MARNVVLLGALILLTSCASDVRALRLEEANLGDPAAVQEIREKLADQDRGAFNSFVFRHYAASASFCGRSLLRTDGKRPLTIGEAIDLTAARDAEERRALAAAREPKSPVELAEQRWNDLISDRDSLIDAQSFLREEHGPSAEHLAEWRSISTRLAELDRRLIELKPRVFGSSD